MPITYAIGDIHGSLNKLKSLVAACEEDAAGREMILVFLGDYIDRGPESAGVVGFMLRLQEDLRERIVTLMGNHEAWALAILDGTMPAGPWLVNGGTATLESYGVGDVENLPRAHLDWMRSLRLAYDDGRRFFVHAGVDPQRPLGAQHESALLWIREPFLDNERDHGRLIVHGHTPVRTGRPDLRSNRLNLDTAAVFGGPLTAAIFNDAQTQPLGYLQAK